MKFYLGTHMANWLADIDVPLFVSRRRLESRKSLPRAVGRWAMDSGGFTELSQYGAWQTTAEDYVAIVRRIDAEVGNLDWVAPMDWMCEPHMLELTGLSAAEHQRRTVDNFGVLRAELGGLVVPVVQGWAVADYARCVELYDDAGIDLRLEPTVGVGSVCRRESTDDASRIFRGLAADGLRCHGFGVKISGLGRYGDALVSSDSMAWSLAGRYERMEGCEHRSCANCRRWALAWRDRVIARIGQQSLWKDVPA